MFCYLSYVSNELIAEICSFLDVQSLQILTMSSKDIFNRVRQNVRSLSNANSVLNVQSNIIKSWFLSSSLNISQNITPSQFSILPNLCSIHIVSPCGKEAVSNIPFIEQFSACLRHGCVPNIQDLLIDINTADILLGPYKVLLTYQHDYDFIYDLGLAAKAGYCARLQSCSISISRKDAYDDLIAELIFKSGNPSNYLKELFQLFQYIASNCPILARFTGILNIYMLHSNDAILL